MRKLPVLCVMGGLVVGSLSGCGTRTHIENQWQAAPEQRASSYHSVLVVSLADEDAVRHQIETALAEQLQAQGIEAFISADKVDQVPDEKTEQLRDKVTAAAREANADVVMVATLLREEVDVSVRQGRVVSQPVPHGAHYDTFNTYWSHQHQAMYAPHMGSVADTGRISAEGAAIGSPAVEQSDAVEIERVYVVETSLYDLETEKPVWVAQSKTMNPDNAEEGIESYAHAVATTLSKDGLLSSAGSGR